MRQSFTNPTKRMTGLALAMALVASACSGSDTQGESSASTAEGVTAETDGPPSAIALSEALSEVFFSDPVVLINPGTEPFVQIRMDLSPGTSQLFTTQTQTFQQSVNGQRLSPASTQTIETNTSLDVTVDGDHFNVLATIESMNATSADNEDVTLLNSALAQSVGHMSTSFLDDRGLLGQTSAGNTTSNVTELLESIGNVANPFPVEAVGVGAIWETRQDLSAFGFDAEQIIQTTITDIDGDIITMSIEGRQEVPVGATITSDGDAITVQEWDVVIEGETVLDLGEIVPIESGSITRTAQVLEINGAIIAQELEIELAISGN